MKIAETKERFSRWGTEMVNHVRKNWRALILMIALVAVFAIFFVYATLVALNNELAQSPFFTLVGGIAIGAAAVLLINRCQVVQAQNTLDKCQKALKTSKQELNVKAEELKTAKVERDEATAQLEEAKKEIARLQNQHQQFQQLLTSVKKTEASAERTERSVERLHERLSTNSIPVTNEDNNHAAEGNGNEPIQAAQTEPKKAPDFSDVDAILCIFHK